MVDSNFYVPFFNVYYIFYFITSICFQFLLIYLITRKSPATLDSLKCYLYNTCITQIFLICVAFFSQHRTLTNKDTCAVLVLGPSRYFGAWFSFCCYHIFMGLSLCAGLAISITVLFRFLVLVQNQVTQLQNYIMIGCTYIAPIILMIIPFTSPWDFPSVRNATTIEHPTYNLSIYEPYPGFADVHSFQFLSATLILCIGAYGIPLVCFFLTRKVLVLIRYHSHMSEKTKKQAQTLVRGLMVQSVLPCISYIPTFTSYVYTQYFGHELLLSEHLILASSSFPGLIDPFISFYFIVPYRQAILEVICYKRKRATVFNLTVTSTSGMQ